MLFYRQLKKYCILAGIWFGLNKLNMKLFMSLLVIKELANLLFGPQWFSIPLTDFASISWFSNPSVIPFNFWET